MERHCLKEFGEGTWRRNFETELEEGALGRHLLTELGEGTWGRDVERGLGDGTWGKELEEATATTITTTTNAATTATATPTATTTTPTRIISHHSLGPIPFPSKPWSGIFPIKALVRNLSHQSPVSYTHLTLPTSAIV